MSDTDKTVQEIFEEVTGEGLALDRVEINSQRDSAGYRSITFRHGERPPPYQRGQLLRMGVRVFE